MLPTPPQPPQHPAPQHPPQQHTPHQYPAQPYPPQQPPPNRAPGPGVDPARARPMRANPLGLLLLLPAAVALLVGYGWPTLRTVWLSFDQRQRFVPEDGDRTLANYERAFNILFDGSVVDSFVGRGAQGYLLALSLALIPLALLVVIAPLLAWAINGAPTPLRRGVRLALTLPLVMVAPSALVVGWVRDRLDLTESTGAGSALRSAVWLTLFGALLAVGTMLFLAAMREPRTGPQAGGGAGWLPNRRVLGGMGAVAAVIVLAAFAIALQSFTYPAYLPGRPTAGIPPLVEIYQQGLARGDFGLAAALSVLLLVPVMVLGIAATLVIIFTRMRIEVMSAGDRSVVAVAAPDPAASAAASAPAGATDGQRRLVKGVIAGAGGLLVLGVWLYQIWPWLSRLGGLGPGDRNAAASIVLHTWAPPLISTLIGVGLAALAGYGIGAMRPMGRWSELLLLPFAPWLFVGVGPLAIAKYDSAAFGPFPRLDTFLVYIPPIWLTIPALFVFTLLFRGLTGQRAAAAAAGPDPGAGLQLVRALPMVALVAGATWLLQSQSLLWGLLVSREEFTGPVWALRMIGFGTGQEDAGFGLVFPIPMLLLFLVGAGVLQLMYLDRVAIRVGRGS
ncbi:hypothetical protein JQS43_24945 [Natronosporangium hydrolyticum]|uniref:Uncharacterized protein n=1 Tax=Natronosporangium hydrolyticum TaxID=2811111 RepID=A0A895YGN6_9ACTN|nr:hypothetical protein [Natronosporangium hydrolyticum]QSB14669.1 hypothetical protein JQS43_24945 [Natronosporangium hydrolyticum]